MNHARRLLAGKEPKSRYDASMIIVTHNQPLRHFVTNGIRGSKYRQPGRRAAEEASIHANRRNRGGQSSIRRDMIFEARRRACRRHISRKRWRVTKRPTGNIVCNEKSCLAGQSEGTSK